MKNKVDKLPLDLCDSSKQVDYRVYIYCVNMHVFMHNVQISYHCVVANCKSHSIGYDSEVLDKHYVVMQKLAWHAFQIHNCRLS